MEDEIEGEYTVPADTLKDDPMDTKVIIIAIMILIIVGLAFVVIKAYSSNEHISLLECRADLNNMKVQMALNETNLIGNLIYNVNENCKKFASIYKAPVMYYDDLEKNRASIIFGCKVNATGNFTMIPESVITIHRG